MVVFCSLSIAVACCLIFSVVISVSSLQLPFRGAQTQPSFPKERNEEQQVHQSSLIAERLLGELEEPQPSRQRIDSLFSSMTLDSKSGMDDFISIVKNQPAHCFFFTSTFDDIDASENTNINDKFWRTAVKHGGGISIDTDGRSENLQSTSTIQRRGPFVATSSPVDPNMYITMPIPLGKVRYTYSINKMDDKSNGIHRVTLLEFQWIVKGKMVYNRVINREEDWTFRYHGIGGAERQETLTYIDIRNANTISDGVYDRSIAVRTSVPEGISMEDYCVGDPSLTLITNVNLGSENKASLLREASSIVASCLSKPESYVAIAILDNHSVIWGGEDSPCMLGTLNSLGAINLENNKACTEKITKLVAPYGINADRIYITFNDVARENMGYNGKTFAG